MQGISAKLGGTLLVGLIYSLRVAAKGLTRDVMARGSFLSRHFGGSTKKKFHLCVFHVRPHRHKGCQVAWNNSSIKLACRSKIADRGRHSQYRIGLAALGRGSQGRKVNPARGVEYLGSP